MCHAPTSRYPTGISLHIQTDYHLLIAFFQPLFRITSWDAYACGFSTIGSANSGPHAKLLKYVSFFSPSFIIYTPDIPLFRKVLSNSGSKLLFDLQVNTLRSRMRETPWKMRQISVAGTCTWPSYTTFPLHIPFPPFIYYFTLYKPPFIHHPGS